ncbi:hypothetical protein BS17DRAFT_795196 [Gyrodon lividus]|nr:hypothetical protein BS17DRAFT_795196 [Gyrodon lividus]
MDYSGIIENLNTTVVALQQQSITIGKKELKFNKKFELTKMQIWINSNWDGMEMNMEICCAVWSRMKGPVARRYTETRMGNCLAEREEWPGWKALKPEIKGFFRPQTETDWARATLQNLKQGMSWVDNFITRFLSLWNSKLEIIKQMYIMGQRKAKIGDAAMMIREISHAQELYHIQFRHQGSTWFNNTKQP